MKSDVQHLNTKFFEDDNLIPGLQGTVFSTADWQEAHAALFEKLNSLIPGFLDKPKSIFVQRWYSQEPFDIGFQIAFYWQCRTLSRKCTVRSSVILNKKIREIVTATDQDKFDEYYTEWCVMDSFAVNWPEIDLEPFSNERSGQPQPSPDFLLRTPEGECCFEVTLCRFPQLDHDATREVAFDFWQAAQTTRYKLGQDYLPRHISFTIPAKLKETDTWQTLKSDMLFLVNSVFDQEHGEMECVVGESRKPVQIKWNIVLDPASFAVTWPQQVCSYTDPKIDKYGNISTGVPISDFWVDARFYPDDIGDILTETLRRVRDTKSKQFKTAIPTVLVMRIGHPLLKYEQVIKAVVERAWTNPRFRIWSGLFIYVARESFARESMPPSTIGLLNPNADLPLGPEFFPSEKGPLAEMRPASV